MSGRNETTSEEHQQKLEKKSEVAFLAPARRPPEDWFKHQARRGAERSRFGAGKLRLARGARFTRPGASVTPNVPRSTLRCACYHAEGFEGPCKSAESAMSSSSRQVQTPGCGASLGVPWPVLSRQFAFSAAAGGREPFGLITIGRES
ncbi:hypothetical protein GN956_G24672 [Arapaima gigas]